ncbi:hypothetical protein M0804_004143 [Polistes exclamans]|nr:hypothetical protein M0804_004143 [Polistes exclamans]
MHQPVQRKAENSPVNSSVGRSVGRSVGWSSRPSTFMSTEKSMRQKSSRGVNSGYTDSDRSLASARHWLPFCTLASLLYPLSPVSFPPSDGLSKHYTEKMDEGNIDRYCPLKIARLLLWREWKSATSGGL